MSIVGYKSQNHPQQTGKRGANDAVDDRGTAPEVFGPLMERFGFTLDVAAAAHNAKTERFYTRKDNGLEQSWSQPRSWIGPPCLMCNGTGVDRFDHPDHGPKCRACNGHGRQAVDAPNRERIWCNPPYSDCRAWVEKAWVEWGGPASQHWQHKADRPDTIVMLLPANRVEQAWWQDLVEPHRDRPGSPLRVEFLRGRMRFIRPDWTPGPKGDRPPFGCCLLIWGEIAW